MRRDGKGGREQIPVAPIYEIGGERFVEILEGTWERDLEYMALYTDSGLDDIALHEGESPDMFAVRIQNELLRGRKGPEMLGCLLMPERRAGEPWTLQIAGETAAFFRRSVTKPEDKELLGALLVKLVLDFFARGMVSFSISRRSSTQKTENRPEAERPAETAMAIGEASPAL